MTDTENRDNDADSGLSSHDLLCALRSAVACMPTHQRERQNGKLLIDALAEIERLKQEAAEWREKAEHMAIACKVWEDASVPHPIPGVNCDIFGGPFSSHNTQGLAHADTNRNNDTNHNDT